MTVYYECSELQQKQWIAQGGLAQWISGAQKNENTIQLQPSCGAVHNFTFVRPDAPGLEKDLDYADNLRQQAQMNQQLYQQERLVRVQECQAATAQANMACSLENSSNPIACGRARSLAEQTCYRR